MSQILSNNTSKYIAKTTLALSISAIMFFACYNPEDEDPLFNLIGIAVSTVTMFGGFCCHWRAEEEQHKHVKLAIENAAALLAMEEGSHLVTPHL